MLRDMLRNLANAETKKEQEKAFKELEKVGMDRRTALMLVAELKLKNGKGEGVK